MALEKLEGCADVYIDSKAGITLAMTRDQEAPDAAALGEVLAPHKIKVVKIARWHEPLYE